MSSPTTAAEKELAPAWSESGLVSINDDPFRAPQPPSATCPGTPSTDAGDNTRDDARNNAGDDAPGDNPATAVDKATGAEVGEEVPKKRTRTASKRGAEAEVAKVKKKPTGQAKKRKTRR